MIPTKKLGSGMIAFEPTIPCDRSPFLRVAQNILDLIVGGC